MAYNKVVAFLVVCSALVSLVITTARADEPSPAATPVATGPARPAQAEPIETAIWHLERDSAAITILEAAPAASPSEVPPSEHRLSPGIPVAASRGEVTLRLLPGQDADATSQGTSPPDVRASVSQYPTFADFETAFPGDWTCGSNKDAFWGRVNCNALEGNYAAWPAADGSSGVDPCAGNNYPNNLNSWMIFGPFSLMNYRAAEIGFFFRLESQAGYDKLFWGASTNGNDFYGYSISGRHVSGLYRNGYNLATLDLANVPSLGDLTGRSGLYIAIAFRSDGSVNDRGPFVDVVWLRVNTDRRQYITDEGFDDPYSTYPNWYVFDNDGAANGEYWWGRVNCFAHSDGWALWPAAGGGNRRNPCAGETYPNNAQSWALYGPFSLSGVSEAWVDFYFRSHSEPDYDRFAWLASVDGDNFYGYGVSGDYWNGPYNSHNLGRFYLDYVPTLGDLRGRSQVWLAFIFRSNASTVVGHGPFLDDVRVIVERPVSGKVYLPVVRRAPTVALTTLYVENRTSGVVHEYRVYSGGTTLAHCTNILAGGRVQCGAPFPPGTYRVVVSTAQCGSSSGQVSFPAGVVTRVVRCVRD